MRPVGGPGILSRYSLKTSFLAGPLASDIYINFSASTSAFKVRFRNEGGWSNYSDENGDATIHVRELFAGQPQAAQNICSSREIEVTWSEPKKNPESVDHYLLAIQGKGAENHEQVRVGRSQRLARFKDLVPNNEYEITIIAFTGSNYATPPIKLNVCTKPAVPNKPVAKDFVWSGPDFDNTVDVEIPKPKDDDCNGRPVIVISVLIEAFFTILGAPVPINMIKTRKEFDVEWFGEAVELIFLDLPNVPIMKQFEMGSELVYSVKLALLNEIGCSDYSESMTFSAKHLLPGEPQNVKVVGISESKFKLSWEPPTRNPYSVEDYMLHIVEKKSHKEKLLQLPAKATDVTIYNVEPSTKYDMQLCAHNIKQKKRDTGIVKATTKCSTAMRRAITAGTGILGSVVAPITSTALLVRQAKKYYNEDEAEKALVVGLLTPMVVPASIILPPASGIIAAVDMHQHLSSTGDLESTEFQFDFKAKKPEREGAIDSKQSLSVDHTGQSEKCGTGDFSGNSMKEHSNGAKPGETGDVNTSESTEQSENSECSKPKQNDFVRLLDPVKHDYAETKESAQMGEIIESYENIEISSLSAAVLKPANSMKPCADDENHEQSGKVPNTGTEKCEQVKDSVARGNGECSDNVEQSEAANVTDHGRPASYMEQLSKKSDGTDIKHNEDARPVNFPEQREVLSMKQSANVCKVANLSDHGEVHRPVNVPVPYDETEGCEDAKKEKNVSSEDDKNGEDTELSETSRFRQQSNHSEDAGIDKGRDDDFEDANATSFELTHSTECFKQADFSKKKSKLVHPIQEAKKEETIVSEQTDCAEERELVDSTKQSSDKEASQFLHHSQQCENTEHVKHIERHDTTKPVNLTEESELVDVTEEYESVKIDGNLN